MYILFDIGGTKMRVAASKDGRSFGKPLIKDTPQSYKAGLEQFIAMARELSEGQKIKAIAGGIAGIQNKNNESVFHSPNFPDWDNKPLKRDIEKALKSPFVMDNDAAVIGLAEAIHGAGRGYRIVMYYTVSTGVGGARIINKKIDEKVYGFEPGWQVIDLQNNDFSSFKSLGGYISGKALEKKYGLPAMGIKNKKIWEQVTKLLAIGLRNSISHWSPDIVVIGGGISKDIQIPELKKELKKLLDYYPTIPEIKKFKLGDKAGFYGALELLKTLKKR